MNKVGTNEKKNRLNKETEDIRDFNETLKLKNTIN